MDGSGWSEAHRPFTGSNNDTYLLAVNLKNGSSSFATLGPRKMGAAITSEVSDRAFAPIPPVCPLRNCPARLEQVCNAAMVCIPFSGPRQAWAPKLVMQVR